MVAAHEDATVAVGRVGAANAAAAAAAAAIGKRLVAVAVGAVLVAFDRHMSGVAVMRRLVAWIHP